jgi:hypothetical protein
MMTELMDAFNHPGKKNCFYSFNVEQTASERLNALGVFDWTPERSLDVPDNTTCLFPLGLGCPEVRFDHLRAEGGYTVRAVCREGKTTACRVTADRARSLQLRFKAADLSSLGTSKGSAWKTGTVKGWTVISVDLKAEESLFLGDRNGFSTPVAEKGTGRRHFHFGMNAEYLSGGTEHE